MTKNMVKGPSPGSQATCIKEVMFRMREKAMERCSGQMAPVIGASGGRVFNMALAR